MRGEGEANVDFGDDDGDAADRRRRGQPAPPRQGVYVPGPPAPPPLPTPRTGAAPPQRARLNQNSYFSYDDYPAAALRARAEGSVVVDLVIGADGRVSGCTVFSSSGSAALDAATCRILRSRARYRPAFGRDGNPVSGTDSSRITWRLPSAGPPPYPVPRVALLAPDMPPSSLRGAPPAPPRHWSVPWRARENLGSYFSVDDYPAAALRARIEGVVGFTLVVDPDGRVSDCSITGPSGSADLDAATCRILRSRARYTPARNAAGEPVSGSDRGAMTWRLPPD